MSSRKASSCHHLVSPAIVPPRLLTCKKAQRKIWLQDGKTKSQSACRLCPSRHKDGGGVYASGGYGLEQRNTLMPPLPIFDHIGPRILESKSRLLAAVVNPDWSSYKALLLSRGQLHTWPPAIFLLLQCQDRLSIDPEPKSGGARRLNGGHNCNQLSF